jgi:hypothetical protein
MPFAWHFVIKRVGGGLGIDIGRSSLLFGLAGVRFVIWHMTQDHGKLLIEQA